MPLATTWTNSGTGAPPFATTVAAAAGIKTVQSRLRPERPALRARAARRHLCVDRGVDSPTSGSSLIFNFLFLNVRSHPVTVVRRTTSDFSFFKAEDKKVCERAKCSAPSFTPRHRRHFASLHQRAEQLERTHVRCPTACTCASCCVEPNPILLTPSSLTSLSRSSQTTPSENPGGYVERPSGEKKVSTGGIAAREFLPGGAGPGSGSAFYRAH